MTLFVASFPQEAPNAFATGRDPEHGVVAVTQGVMRLLSPEELRGVLAHELSHYFQWLNHHDVWLSDDPETNRRLERQAVYYADAILDDYAETVDHP